MKMSARGHAYTCLRPTSLWMGPKRRVSLIHANRPSPALTGKSSSSSSSRMGMNPANIGTVSSPYRHTTRSCPLTLPLFSTSSREPGAAVPSFASIYSTLYHHSQNRSERPLGWTNGLRPEARDIGENTQFWRICSSKEPKLRERVYKGISDRWRSAAWNLSIHRYASTGLDQTALLASDYRDTLDEPSTYDIQIDLDVPRTISGHVMFRTRYGAGLSCRTQRSLFHVLHSFVYLLCRTTERILSFPTPLPRFRSAGI